MARALKNPVWPVALSLTMCAAALQCRKAMLVDAVKAGKLVAYIDPTHNTRSRVLVADLQDYVRSHWKKDGPQND